MSRVLVTGAAGFLGSHLCERLLDDGHEVVGMDNLVSGRTDNLNDIFYDDRFTYYEHDVTEFIHLSGGLDWVCHLASLASPVFYKENPIKTLGLAKEKDAKYLSTSTSEVYRDPEMNPQPEDYRGNVDSYGPRSCYDESKRYGESMVRAYRDEHETDVRVARIFNTYGPRMRTDDGRVIPTFIRQALCGADLTVHGDGEQTRSFCYVSDLIDGLVALMRSSVQTPVNIGNSDERAILELAERILDLTDSESGIVHESRPPQDPEVRRPDLTKAATELNWGPEVPLNKGLEQTIRYFEGAI